MAEQLTLTTPVKPTSPDITGYRVWSTYFGYGEGVIRIVVEDNNGARSTAVYADAGPDTTATTLMRALNTANLATKSGQRRILERLAADGKLRAGSVEGVPD